MNKIAPFLLLFTLSFQVFLHAGLAGMYELNKSYISSNFCENQNKPEMHCNGKCFLKKQFKKADDGAGKEKLPSGLKQITDMQLFVQLFVDVKNFIPFSIMEKGEFPLIAASSYLASIYHPPRQ